MPLYQITVPSVTFVIDAPNSDEAADQVRDTLLEIATSWDGFRIEDY